MNVKSRTIFCEDNYYILKGMDSNIIDLIYLDPPFNSNRKYTAPVGSKAKGAGFSDIFREEDVKNSWVKILEKHYKNLSIYLSAVKQTSNKSNYCYLVYMSIRLIEMHRILKDNGSIYLHCDSTMSHYLKQVLDIIFGEKNFRNHICWHYNKWTNSAKHFQKNTDAILFYTKTDNYVFNKEYIFTNYQKGIIEKGFTTNKPRGVGRQLIVYDKEKSKEEIAKKKYDKIIYREQKGTVLSDNWDINYISSNSKERVGYPTQKPLALLDRIIKASSDEGDVVLDPFCGCATTCVSAELLDRQWIGIDVSKEAYRLVKSRLESEVERKDTLLENIEKKVIYREDIPIRGDLPKDKRSKNEIKKHLYGEQDGDCNLCNTHFDSKDHFHLDHITPKSKGGIDHPQNYQLLCGRCNILKKDKTMAEAMELARKKEIIKEIAL